MQKSSKQKILKISIIIAILVAIILATYLPLKLSGALDKIDSPEKLKEIILQAGAYSYVLFFVLQFFMRRVVNILKTISILGVHLASPSPYR